MRRKNIRLITLSMPGLPGFAALLLALLAMIAGCDSYTAGRSRGDGFERLSEAPVRTFMPAGQVVADLTARIPGLMQAATIPGLSIALVREGEVVWTAGFGVKSTSTGGAVTSDTVFEACSLSKPVFAWAVMRMVEEGSIDLDRPLHEYTGREFIEREFLREEASDDRIWRVTARMVLAHMTGLPNWRNNGPIGFSFDPGRGFAYSGEGYVLLQAVVEEIKGRRLESLMREYVFDPLAMDSSSFVWREEYHETGAFPHTVTGMAIGKRIRRRGSAAASLYTTAADFGRFIAAVLTRRGMSREVSEEMLSSQCMLATEQPGVLSWGLGFGLQNVGSENSFWHWGDNGEFKCCMLTYLGWNSGVVY
ncbi:MAG TPA: serine hydrolase domain-containing protein, partial [Candidatus Krumholzibacterium sp.]|nr:serine hydrolase domain-containing protein [Candidatus Krumholzibacterium sp.]